jgi:hypothetical protein
MARHQQPPSEDKQSIQIDERATNTGASQEYSIQKIEQECKEIVTDYHKSDAMRASSASEATKPRRKGRFDHNVFAGSPREAWLGALEFLRAKYGLVSHAWLS